MKEQFINWNPNRASKHLLGEVQTILKQYEEQGYSLTLRQLYYQLVARDLLPEQWADKDTGSTNNPQSYKKLGHIITKARLAGLVDWDMIEDRSRSILKNSHWNNPKHILNAAAKQFYMARWKNQPNYVFVMAEKDAVSNIIEPVCREWDVPFMANKGYSSQSALYQLYNIFEEKIDNGKDIHCIYVGDFDPSGLDMDRDLRDRLQLFLSNNVIFFDHIRLLDLKRAALTESQIEKYKPPENPAKVTDSRFKQYMKKYGKSSWELDALEPATLEEIVKNAILKYVDMEEFERVEEKEREIRVKIKKFAETWSK